MRILGIETSCDETAVAVVEDGIKILSSVIASSSEIHAKTGGIIPEQAARAQIQSIIPIIIESIADAASIPNFQFPISNEHQKIIQKYIDKNITSVAVTYGPGLIGSLLVGLETAKTLSYLWKKPLIPVNHLVGHIYANFIRELPSSNLAETSSALVKDQALALVEDQASAYFQFPNKLPEFPALALVVSGGHTDLVLMAGHGKFKWIGGTRDDAAGEAFDKTARLLGLPYPGGPAIAAAAAKYLRKTPTANHNSLNMFPRPMINKDNFDWSFSGLKTAVLKEFNQHSSQKNIIPRYSAEVQEAIVEVLVYKTIKAAKKYKPKSILLAGGVAANNRLREKFQFEIRNSKLEIDLFIPPPKFCTDNAAYIASCAYFNNNPVNWNQIAANPQLSIMGEI